MDQFVSKNLLDRTHVGSTLHHTSTILLYSDNQPDITTKFAIKFGKCQFCKGAIQSLRQCPIRVFVIALACQNNTIYYVILVPNQFLIWLTLLWSICLITVWITVPRYQDLLDLLIVTDKKCMSCRKNSLNFRVGCVFLILGLA